MKTTTNFQEAQQAVEQGKVVKTKQGWREVLVASLTSGLYGYSNEMRWTHFSESRAQYTNLSGLETFTIYE